MRPSHMVLVLAALLLLPTAAALPTEPDTQPDDNVLDRAKEIATEDQPEDPREVVDEIVNGGGSSEPGEGEDGSGGWWEWEDVERVGAHVSDAITGPWGIAALILGAAGSGGAWWFAGTRLKTPEEVLENDVRQSIYAYVKETTGAHLHQISDDLDLSTTNAVWHLRKLEAADLVKSKKFNGHRIYYPVDGGVEAKKLSIAVSVLGNDNAHSIFDHLLESPGDHQRAIARALDTNHGTVRWHLRKMRKAEMVVETKKGNATKYFPTDLGRKALAEVRGTTVDAVPAPATTPSPA